MTGTHLIAQFIGLAGIALLMGSTLMRSRRKLLAMDAAGSAVMGIHWALLGGLSAVAISAIVIVMDLAGTDPRNPRGRLVIWATIPVTVVLVALLWTGPSDLLAAAGMLTIAASRLSFGQIRLRALAMASCVPWFAYGAILVSIPQMTMSAIYFVAMGISILRIRSGRWRSPAPADAAILPADGT